jgi:hypothetical protein
VATLGNYLAYAMVRQENPARVGVSHAGPIRALGGWAKARLTIKTRLARNCSRCTNYFRAATTGPRT